MNIIIFGSNGMLGNYVASYLSKSHNIIKITRKDYDIEKNTLKELHNLLKLHSTTNDIVINCSGIIPQSSNNKISRKKYLTINSTFPIALSVAAEVNNYRMIHISTDGVFSGNRGNYNENDEHDSTSDYGASKSIGELCNTTIIRTSIIGEEQSNKSLLEWVRSNKNKKIDGFTNQFWNGITCLQLAKIISKIISNNIFWIGVRHLHSPSSISKHDLICIINKIYNLNIEINEVALRSKIDKSLTSIYNNDFNIPSITQQIIELKDYII